MASSDINVPIFFTKNGKKERFNCVAASDTNSYNLTENEKREVNNFLSKDLYKKELKFSRPAAEVESITDGVKNIVNQLMTAVGVKEPLLEISHQYLVGSMAERTSIVEPDEFDYLVVLKHFSVPGAISFHKGDLVLLYYYYVCNENIDLSLRTSENVRFNEDQKVEFKDCFMSTILKNIILSITEPLHVETDHGKLTINSTTICHHGPASVVKLLWEPKSESSKLLDILIDITPCIEQKGINKIKDSKVIPNGYKSHIFNDDTFMLIPMFNENTYTSTAFEAAITTTEVNIVNTLSSHHKTIYMILKYCLNSILVILNENISHTLLPTYLIKIFILRHVMRCETDEKSHHDTEECLFTCLSDVTDDLKKSVSKGYVDGIFGTVQHVQWYRVVGLSEFLKQVIDNVIGRLVQIGKEGYSVYQHEDFAKACWRPYTHKYRHLRAARLARGKVECNLSASCRLHQWTVYGFDGSDESD